MLPTRQMQIWHISLVSCHDHAILCLLLRRLFNSSPEMSIWRAIRSLIRVNDAVLSSSRAAPTGLTGWTGSELLKMSSRYSSTQSCCIDILCKIRIFRFFSGLVIPFAWGPDLKAYLASAQHFCSSRTDSLLTVAESCAWALTTWSGQLHCSLLEVQFLQSGYADSSHFFLRLRQVKQPLLDLAWGFGIMVIPITAKSEENVWTFLKSVKELPKKEIAHRAYGTNRDWICCRLSLALHVNLRLIRRLGNIVLAMESLKHLQSLVA